MQIPIHDLKTLGQVVRASRKAQNLRQDDAAGSIGVSENFLGKVERGGETVQWGKLFQVIQELGLTVSVEVPEPYAQDTQTTLAKRRLQQATPSATASVKSPQGNRT